MQDEDEPLYITWFAMAHAAVLLYLALEVVKAMSPMECGLAGGAVLLVGLALSFLLRTRMSLRGQGATVRASSDRRI